MGAPHNFKPVGGYVRWASLGRDGKKLVKSWFNAVLHLCYKISGSQYQHETSKRWMQHHVSGDRVVRMCLEEGLAFACVDEADTLLVEQTGAGRLADFRRGIQRVLWEWERRRNENQERCAYYSQTGHVLSREMNIYNRDIRSVMS